MLFVHLVLPIFLINHLVFLINSWPLLGPYTSFSQSFCPCRFVRDGYEVFKRDYGKREWLCAVELRAAQGFRSEEMKEGVKR